MSSRHSVIQRSMSWTAFGEIAAKLITPVSNMVLARILTPEDFGVVAICNMVVSFADIITDAGFGKYLVQADFESGDDRDNCANVAFWSNMILSCIIVVMIVSNRYKIAAKLGSAAYSTVISVSSLQLIFTSVSSIQTGLFRRDFEYKKLSLTRIVISALPLVVAVPLAIRFRTYWAIVIGNVIGSFANASILTSISSWRPRLYYSIDVLSEMISYSFWSLCEGLANWIIFWFDTFIVAQVYSAYYVGLYKNSSSVVISIMGMVTATISPVLMSVLSRVKNDEDNFSTIYLSIQHIVIYIVMPISILLFSYRFSVTEILFGNRWLEASNVVGSWALMMMLSVVFYSLPAELYKSKGIPKILFAFQLSFVFFAVPVCVIASRLGFWTFVFIRCICIIEQAVVSLVLTSVCFHIPPMLIIKNCLRPLFSSIIIFIVAFYAYSITDNIILIVISMVFSIVLYCMILYIFCIRDIRKSLRNIYQFKISDEL